MRAKTVRTRSALVGVGLLVAALILGGCDWTSFRDGGLRTGFNGTESGAGAISTANAGSLHVTQRLINGLGNSTSHTSPVVANGRLYMVGTDAKLHVLDGAGNEVQNSPVKLGNDLSGQSFAAPTVDNGTVFVDGANTLYAFDATSLALKWAVKTDGYWQVGPFSSPVVGNGKVIVGANNGVGYVDIFNASSGAKLDSFRLGDYLTTPIAVANGWFFVGGQSGGLYARDMSRVQPGWTWLGSSTITGVAVAGNDLVVSINNGNLQEFTTGGTHVGAFKNFDGSTVTPASAPAIANGIVYAGAGNGTLKSFSLATQQQVAQSVNVTNVGQVSVANGIVFSTGQGAALWAFNAGNLSPLFSSNTNVANGSEPVVANGHVYDVLPNGVLEIWNP
jgi:outer membrane protein assembly factor BamB